MTTHNYVIPVWIRLPKNRKVKTQYECINEKGVIEATAAHLLMLEFPVSST